MYPWDNSLELERATEAGKKKDHILVVVSPTNADLSALLWATHQTFPYFPLDLMKAFRNFCLHACSMYALCNQTCQVIIIMTEQGDSLRITVRTWCVTQDTAFDIRFQQLSWYAAHIVNVYAYKQTGEKYKKILSDPSPSASLKREIECLELSRGLTPSCQDGYFGRHVGPPAASAGA